MNFKNPYGQQVPKSTCCNDSGTSFVNNVMGKAYEVVRYVASKIPLLESLLERINDQITYSIIIKGQMQLTDFVIPFPEGITLENIQFTELWVFPKDDNKYRYENFVLTPVGISIIIDPNAPVIRQDMAYEWVILGASESLIIIPEINTALLDKNSYYGGRVINGVVVPDWLQFSDLVDNVTIFFDNTTGKFNIGETLPSTVSAVSGDILQLDANKEPVWNKTTLNEILPTNLGGTGNAEGLAQGLVIPRVITGNMNMLTSTSFDGSQDINIAIDGVLPIAKGGTGNTQSNALLWNGSALFIYPYAPASADGKNGDIWIQLPA